jgi:hypothetical protein
MYHTVVDLTLKAAEVPTRNNGCPARLSTPGVNNCIPFVVRQYLLAEPSLDNRKMLSQYVT